MTTHLAPVRGDKFSAVVPCCGIPLRDLPETDGLARDWETPSCGLPVVDTDDEPAPRAA